MRKPSLILKRNYERLVSPSRGRNHLRRHRRAAVAWVPWSPQTAFCAAVRRWAIPLSLSRRLRRSTAPPPEGGREKPSSSSSSLPRAQTTFFAYYTFPLALHVAPPPPTPVPPPFSRPLALQPPTPGRERKPPIHPLLLLLPGHQLRSCLW